MARGSPNKRGSGAINITVNRTIESCARLAELHPYIWKLAWEAVHRLPFLLPHDKSYRALRHFIAAKPEGLFLDVGANDGISTLSFRKFSKNYRILALEPNPMLEPALKIIKSSDPRFEYKMVGAGSAASRMKFFVPTYNGIVLHTFTSGDRDQLLRSVAQSFGSKVAHSTEVRAFNAEIIPLDELHVDPAIIKIDAEGFDYAVLQGAGATIERARPFIITEIASAEYGKIKTYFDNADYVLLAYDLASDRFISDLDSWIAAVDMISGHRNFFAIPEEMMNLIPLEMSSEPKM